MSDDEKASAHALISHLLQEGEQKASEGSYPTALIPIRRAKALDRTNVYILALERQVEQLNELAGAGQLSEEQQTDILDSLPVLVENALRNPGPLQSPGATPGDRVDTLQEDKERRAAAQWLKNQYFQRAHAFVKRGEYDLALEEVQRVIALDKQDRFASEFELKIMQMIELRRHQPLVNRAGPGPGRTPASTEAPLSGGPAGQAPGPAEHTGRKKTPLMMLAILITIVCVALAIYFFSTRNQAARQYVPAVIEPAPEGVDDHYPPLPPASVADSSESADSNRSSKPPDSLGR